MVIGVTGGFGVGKTVFCKFLEKLGAARIETDDIVHRLYEPGKLGFQKIRGYFGEEFVNPAKGVLRDKLRDVVLRNPQKLWILTKLILPTVKDETVRKIKKIRKKYGLKKLICVEAIFFEKENLGVLVDKIVLLNRKVSLIRKKTKKQWKLEDIERFIRLQPMFPNADFTIDNIGTLRELRAKAHEIFLQFS